LAAQQQSRSRHDSLVREPGLHDGNRLLFHGGSTGGLYQRRLTKTDVFEFFRVIDWILDLPEDLQEQFREDIHRYEEEKKMPYISSLERMALKEGREEGREIGLREGLLEWVACALETFGQPGRKLLAKARRVKDVNELRRLSQLIQAAKTLDEVRRHLS
jgi:hypothetical protein